MVCIVCFEPWSAYEVRHGWETWEKLGFLKGAGCPCCRGVSPVPEEEEPDLRLEALEVNLLEGDADMSHDMLMNLESQGWDRPEWKRPG